MAFQAKDGSRHTNHSTMKAADARFGAKQNGPKKIGGGSPGGGSAGLLDAGGGDDDMQQGGQDGAQLAAEHGPATQLDVQHDHEAGRHTVHAVHPDGHEHESEHPSAEEAHKFAADCAGCSSAGDGGGMDEGDMQ